MVAIVAISDGVLHILLYRIELDDDGTARAAGGGDIGRSATRHADGCRAWDVPCVCRFCDGGGGVWEYVFAAGGCDGSISDVQRVRSGEPCADGDAVCGVGGGGERGVDGWFAMGDVAVDAGDEVERVVWVGNGVFAVAAMGDDRGASAEGGCV